MCSKFHPGSAFEVGLLLSGSKHPHGLPPTYRNPSNLEILKN